jgi:hypothetical protein
MKQIHHFLQVSGEMYINHFFQMNFVIQQVLEKRFPSEALKLQEIG